MYHAHDGWYFWRNEFTGAVVVEHRVPTGETNELGEATYTIDAKTAFDVDEWASIVASVSDHEDSREAWLAARDFHNGEVNIWSEKTD